MRDQVLGQGQPMRRARKYLIVAVCFYFGSFSLQLTARPSVVHAAKVAQMHAAEVLP
jgi:hypothetical protein